jgi:hypothetical protein
MTPNIGLTSFLLLSTFYFLFLLSLLRPGPVRIDAAFDLRQALLMPMNHADDCNDSADEDSGDRNQQTAQTEDSIHEISHACSAQTALFTTGFLVELTGIEPVASWLQTRRSPS